MKRAGTRIPVINILSAVLFGRISYIRCNHHYHLASPFISIFIQEIVPYAILLILNYGIQVDILHTSENIGLDKRVSLF